MDLKTTAGIHNGVMNFAEFHAAGAERMQRSPKATCILSPSSLFGARNTIALFVNIAITTTFLQKTIFMLIFNGSYSGKIFMLRSINLIASDG